MSARLVSLFPCSPSSYCHIPLSLEDPIVQWPRTPPFHGGNTGSNPVRVAIMLPLDNQLQQRIHSMSQRVFIKLWRQRCWLLFAIFGGRYGRFDRSGRSLGYPFD
jgi:hypothetical protein